MTGFDDLVPPGVSVLERSVDHPLADPVPAEEGHLGAATPERVREFRAGRGCARAALEALAALGALRSLGSLGEPGCPLPVGPDRAPVWPEAVTGSITHAVGRVAAAVGEVSAYAGIGIDLERCGPLALAVTDLVLPLRSERDLLEPFGSDATVLGFSAKESVYKACSPVTGWLEHSDVVLVAASLDMFRAWVPRAGVEVIGAWSCDGELVRTVATRPGGPLVVLD